MGVERYEVFRSTSVDHEWQAEVHVRRGPEDGWWRLILGPEVIIDTTAVPHNELRKTLEAYRDIFAAAADSLRVEGEAEVESPATTVAYWRWHGNERRLYSSRGMHVATVYSSNETWEWRLWGCTGGAGGGEPNSYVAEAMAANAAIDRGLL